MLYFNLELFVDLSKTPSSSSMLPCQPLRRNFHVYTTYVGLQRVPPVEETSRKMERYLFERTSSRLVKRALKRPEDVLMVIDSSMSVPEANFTQGLEALKRLVTRFRPSTNFAAILFSTKAEVMFPFVSPQKAMKNLVDIRYNGGYTNTQAALRKSGKLFSDKKAGVRDYAYKRMFILTDGQSNIKKKNTLYLAYLLKDMGVEVFVMAVGERIVGIAELAMLATSTDKHLYRVDLKAYPILDLKAYPILDLKAYPILDLKAYPILDLKAYPYPRPQSIPYPRPKSIPYPRPKSIPYPRPQSIPYPRPKIIPYILDLKGYPILDLKAYPILDLKAYPILDLKAYPILDLKAHPILDLKAYLILDLKAYPILDLKARGSQCACALGLLFKFICLRRRGEDLVVNKMECDPPLPPMENPDYAPEMNE
ncbi:hypothetical protein QZH41_004475 [Actinostola sp. cb2023]|nr:hypothetical protein QZH41_004475 [Actinostola sp. cb2023]